MSPSEQRIKLAEFMGWKWVRDGFSKWRFYPKSEWSKFRPDWLEKHSSPTEHDKEFSSETFKQVPDYPEDLNAVRSVEEKLSDEHMDRYIKNLVEVVNLEGGYYICASAAQRCEALIRTLNL